jgi:hypothetical protein
MRWKKLGLILTPQPDIPWMTDYAGPTFVRPEKDHLKMFVTGRDKSNVSRIGLVRARIEQDRFRVDSISPQPVFDVGEAGLFDENGVSYPWLIESQGRIFMYYVGWVAGGRTRFQNFTGLAISSDQGESFQRVHKVPILDRTPKEPYGSGSCCVYIEDSLWHMYYTAFDPWDIKTRDARPHYNLKYAHSTNGIDWVRNQTIVIDYKSDEEYVIGKPMVLRDGNKFHLWYSHRGARYRIGYAESVDGLIFHRKDKDVGIDVSPSGWDCEMIEYAFVFDWLGKRYMVYNGNSFGKSGLGLAVLENEGP